MASAVAIGQRSANFLNGFAKAKLLSINNFDCSNPDYPKSETSINKISDNKISQFSKSLKIPAKPTTLLENTKQYIFDERNRQQTLSHEVVYTRDSMAGCNSNEAPEPTLINTLIFNEEGKEPLLQQEQKIKTGEAYFLHWRFVASWLVLLIANLYVFSRYRAFHISKVTAVRAKISQDLHDNIGAALSSISIFCHAAIQKNESGNIAESRQILERIGETSRDVMKDLNESVWLINPVNDNLQKIIQRINNYALPLCTTKDIYFEVSAAESVQNLDLSVEKRKAIYLFLKEAINNCLKYARCKKPAYKIR